MKARRVTIKHKQCGGVAFYYDHEPQRTERFSSKYASHADRSPIAYGSVSRCDDCGEPVRPLQLTWPQKSW